jgi:hypothetical protein
LGVRHDSGMLFWDCLVWGCFTNIAILTNREGAKGAKEETEGVDNFCQGCYEDFNLTSVVCSSFLVGRGFYRRLWLIFN